MCLPGRPMETKTKVLFLPSAAVVLPCSVPCGGQCVGTSSPYYAVTLAIVWTSVSRVITTHSSPTKPPLSLTHVHTLSLSISTNLISPPIGAQGKLIYLFCTVIDLAVYSDLASNFDLAVYSSLVSNLDLAVFLILTDVPISCFHRSQLSSVVY